MKKRLFPLLLITLISLMPSCKEVSDTDGKTLVIQDSLKNIFPTWQALKIIVPDDKTEMNVIMGDATFYNASPEVKNKKAEELGQMVLRIYGKDNNFSKGNLVVTKDIHNTSQTPADGISTPINFVELNKVMYQK